jgi:predicted RNase H-like nuclease (RuvC/YqgF family)
MQAQDEETVKKMEDDLQRSQDTNNKLVVDLQRSELELERVRSQLTAVQDKSASEVDRVRQELADEVARVREQLSSALELADALEGEVVRLKGICSEVGMCVDGVVFVSFESFVIAKYCEIRIC